ncbi:hypothetical protein F8B43_4265 [Methylorubrum populi]|uniref:Uncharacterized protein n=1 Tax=Methylorubrum populi TaxID=223967 RepID=A0A833J431_9HYPH|nr:hypothetical protein F8B43_4265 [Methylorubrum populi]
MSRDGLTARSLGLHSVQAQIRNIPSALPLSFLRRSDRKGTRGGSDIRRWRIPSFGVSEMARME